MSTYALPSVGRTPSAVVLFGGRSPRKRSRRLRGQSPGSSSDDETMSMRSRSMSPSSSSDDETVSMRSRSMSPSSSSDDDDLDAHHWSVARRHATKNSAMLRLERLERLVDDVRADLALMRGATAGELASQAARIADIHRAIDALAAAHPRQPPLPATPARLLPGAASKQDVQRELERELRAVEARLAAERAAHAAKQAADASK
jgi:hypothetical protein